MHVLFQALLSSFLRPGSLRRAMWASLLQELAAPVRSLSRDHSSFCYSIQCSEYTLNLAKLPMEIMTSSARFHSIRLPHRTLTAVP